MKTLKYVWLMFYFGLAGVLFSGYLSGVKLFTSTCAFNEPCPYFLGFPACWYGFGMFLIIFLASLFTIFKLIGDKSLAKIESFISGLGILFAGYFTIPEILKLFAQGGTDYSLGLPTCAYGLIFYIIIFVLSVSYLRRRNSLNG